MNFFTGKIHYTGEMWLLEVVPISSSVLKDNTLTYFTTREVKEGMVVQIPLRKKMVSALVLRTDKLSTKKADIKRQNFQLKKIEKIISSVFLSPAFSKMLDDLTRHFLVSRSSLLHFFLPKAILEKEITYRSRQDFHERKTSSPPGVRLPDGQGKISCYQADWASRMNYYKSLIREAFVKRHSTILLLPTQSLAHDTFLKINQGLEDRSFLLHGDLPPKILAKTWQQILSSSSPVVVVGTVMTLAIMRSDVALLIVERESSEEYYHSRRRPFFDVRYGAQSLARHLGLHLVWGDLVLRLGREGTNPFLPPSRILSSAKNRIIDAASRAPSTGFNALSAEFVSYLRNILNQGESVVLITHRRGHSSSTLCQDCGRVLTCPNCTSPWVIHENRFLCHHCLRHEEIPERCPHCNGWRISSYGVGVEKVGEEVRRHFPHITPFRMDTDVVRSVKDGVEIKQKFLMRGGNILIATELFLNFFQEPVPHIGVVTMDGLLSIPDYRMHERMMNILLRLRALSLKSFVIQTRVAAHPLFSYAVSGNLWGFKETELAERKRLGYPPTVDLIKITIEDPDRERVLRNVSSVVKILGEWQPMDFSAFTAKIRGQFRWHILLKLERGSWPTKHLKLREILKNFPPSWKIQVDPPSLL